MDAADAVYRLTRSVPGDERFGLTAQVRRAAASIPSNITEGWGRGATNEYVRFLRYARASLCEVETQLLIAERNGYVTSEHVRSFMGEGDELGRMLLGLIRSLRDQ